MTSKTLASWVVAGVYLWLTIHAHDAVTVGSLNDPHVARAQDISYSDSINPSYSFHIK